MKTLRIAVLVCLTSVAVAAIAAPAAAHKEKYKSKLTFHHEELAGESKFFGKVTAFVASSGKKAKKCRKNRVVIIYRNDRAFNLALTNSRGRWRHEKHGSFPPGIYTAKVTKVVQTPDDHWHKCGRKFSHDSSSINLLN